MIRLDIAHETPQQVTLHISGRLSEAEVRLFEAELSRWFAKKKHIILDLTGLSFLGGYALNLLKDWHQIELVVQDTPRSSVGLLLEAAELPYRRVPYVKPKVS